MCARINRKSWATGNREEVEAKLTRRPLARGVRVELRFGSKSDAGTFEDVAEAADAIRDKLLEWGAA